MNRREALAVQHQLLILRLLAELFHGNDPLMENPTKCHAW